MPVQRLRSSNQEVAEDEDDAEERDRDAVNGGECGVPVGLISARARKRRWRRNAVHRISFLHLQSVHVHATAPFCGRVEDAYEFVHHRACAKGFIAVTTFGVRLPYQPVPWRKGPSEAAEHPDNQADDDTDRVKHDR